MPSLPEAEDVARGIRGALAGRGLVLGTAGFNMQRTPFEVKLKFSEYCFNLCQAISGSFGNCLVEGKVRFFLSPEIFPFFSLFHGFKFQEGHAQDPDKW